MTRTVRLGSPGRGVARVHSPHASSGEPHAAAPQREQELTRSCTDRHLSTRRAARCHAQAPAVGVGAPVWGAGIAPNQQLCMAAARESARRRPRSGCRAPESPGPQCGAGSPLSNAARKWWAAAHIFPWRIRPGGARRLAMAAHVSVSHSAPRATVQGRGDTLDYGRRTQEDRPHAQRPRQRRDRECGARPGCRVRRNSTRKRS